MVHIRHIQVGANHSNFEFELKILDLELSSSWNIGKQLSQYIARGAFVPLEHGGHHDVHPGACTGINDSPVG